MFYRLPLHQFRTQRRVHRLFVLLVVLMLLVVLVVPPLAVEAAMVSARQAAGQHPVPCGWLAVGDAAHPERPRHIVPAPTSDTRECAAPASRLNGTPAAERAVRAASTLSLIASTSSLKTSSTVDTVLRVTALEDGAVDDVIRCRSSFDGAILMGRILDAKTVRLIERERSNSW